MKLVPDWRRVWRYYSTQALIAIAALPMIWMEIPPDIRDLFPEAWRPWAVTAVALSGILGRLIAQRPPE